MTIWNTDVNLCVFQPPRRPDSSDDRYVMTKHAAIYPSEDELQSIQKIVSITERALKLVSDIITDQDKAKEEDKEKKESCKDRWDTCFYFSDCLLNAVTLEWLAFLCIERHTVSTGSDSQNYMTLHIKKQLKRLYGRVCSEWTADSYQNAINNSLKNMKVFFFTIIISVS